MARVKMPGVKIRKSKTSSSSTRSPSPPSATSPPKNSGNQSSSNTSFESLSDHYNEAEIESSNPEINQNLVNIVQTNPETEHATQYKNQLSLAKFSLELFLSTSKLFLLLKL
ncbi:hypothetical protein P8452_22196 [Trifolium repens]|nr:hypothetical protein P8452_22196 [Trifolium repens]